MILDRALKFMNDVLCIGGNDLFSLGKLSNQNLRCKYKRCDRGGVLDSVNSNLKD